MTTTVPSTELVVSVEPLFTESERIALSGFLASYSGLTRDAYSLDLRMFTAWCQQHGLHLFQTRRADIECFGRDMESRGRARATIARRLCTIAGFYRYAVEEELLEHSPAVHVRRPRLANLLGGSVRAHAARLRPCPLTPNCAADGGMSNIIERGSIAPFNGGYPVECP